MKKALIILFSCSIFVLNTKAQNEDFQELTSKLFCNVYVYGKSDSATTEFLNMHFPYLLKKREQGVQYGIPIGKNTKESITSMYFKKHPFFDFKIKEGRLDLATLETAGHIYDNGTELWLFFENKKDADSVYDKLIKIYKKISSENKLAELTDRKVAKFSAKLSDNSIKKAILVLMKDTGTNNYKIYFDNWYDD
jgi:hypothetical protein